MVQTKTDPFHALADPSRREILMLLRREKRTINSLADNFDISRPAVSKHIKVLDDAGFITITDIGRERYCELNPQGFEEVKNWMDFFENFWHEKFRQLEKLLDQKHVKSKTLRKK